MFGHVVDMTTAIGHGTTAPFESGEPLKAFDGHHAVY